MGLVGEEKKEVRNDIHPYELWHYPISSSGLNIKGKIKWKGIEVKNNMKERIKKIWRRATGASDKIRRSVFTQDETSILSVKRLDPNRPMIIKNAKIDTRTDMKKWENIGKNLASIKK